MLDENFKIAVREATNRALVQKRISKNQQMSVLRLMGGPSTAETQEFYDKIVATMGGESLEWMVVIDALVDAVVANVAPDDSASSQ